MEQSVVSKESIINAIKAGRILKAKASYFIPKYYAHPYEYDNWEKIYGTSIINGEFNGFKIIRTNKI